MHAGPHLQKYLIRSQTPKLICSVNKFVIRTYTCYRNGMELLLQTDAIKLPRDPHKKLQT